MAKVEMKILEAEKLHQQIPSTASRVPRMPLWTQEDTLNFSTAASPLADEVMTLYFLKPLTPDDEEFAVFGRYLGYSYCSLSVHKHLVVFVILVCLTVTSSSETLTGVLTIGQ